MSSSKKVRFLRKSSAPGSEAAPDKPLLQKNVDFWKSSAPDSEAARDKWLLQKNVDLLAKVLPQAAKLPGTSGSFKNSRISEKKFCPRQRSCPCQVARSRESGQPLQERARSAFRANLSQNPGFGAQGPAQRARHTCMGLLDLPGSTRLAWVYKSSVGL